jgi:hypothetical protein
MNQWFTQHPWITFIIIYVLLVYVYNKVFRVRKLPILKDLVIYLLIALGAFILLIFQSGQLPIVYCLAAAVLLMFIVRVRTWMLKRGNKEA